MVTFRVVIWVMGLRVTEQNVISTAQGLLRGVAHDGYTSYRGIPYATAADADGRFKKAGLAPFWPGVRDSKECQCSAVSRVEDCLHLDVHVPSVNSGSWPVLVWVTGGTGQYNPRKLIQKGIMVVVVHHRIGPLGFLCLGDEKIPGNAAVKDVVLSLRWVRDNIVAFKGNPAKVVVAGQSLGAAIVEAVTLSPTADGLYHGAILQSGTILAPWAFNYDAKERAVKIGDMISNEQNSTSVLMDAKIEVLFENGNKLNVPYIPFVMCIENPSTHEERLLLEAPFDLLTNKKFGRVPMIIGFNSDEAYIFSSILTQTKLSKSTMYKLLPQELKFLNDREMHQISRQIEEVYFRSNMSMSSMLSYHRDAYFVNHIYRSARLHASAHPVYFYQFSHSSNLGVQPEPGINKMGAAHSDELTYLFSGRDLTRNDEIVQRNIINLWTNFVKYLNPSFKESVSWDAVDADQPRLLDVGAELKMMTYPHAHASTMWDHIFDKYYYSRNRELEQVKPWSHVLDASKEGPVCPQHDEVWSRLIAPYQGSSEACIYGNVYVPIAALPRVYDHEGTRYGYNQRDVMKSGLRILVFIHGGAFQAGSGDTDMYGPEYLVGEGIILITFNYRINVFGFLSLNTPKIPGNAGLRDMITFLRWVRRNAGAFGGDPDEVTLMGQSSGAACAHILSLSKEAKGLFKRVILLSGTANLGAYTTSPINAKIVASLFLAQLGINSTDPDVTHDQLIKIPLEQILKANSEVQYKTGFISFSPVVETPFPGVVTVLEDDPVELIKAGRGKEYPLLIQFSSNECESFRRRLEFYEFTRRIEANPTLLLSPRTVFSTLPSVSLELARKVMRIYFKGRPTLDEYMDNCKDVIFQYPSFKVAEWRASMEGAPVYLSQFAYESEAAIVKKAILLDDYRGAAHEEDLTYIFKTNSILGEFGRLPPRDDMMKEWLKRIVINFMTCSNPTCAEESHSLWPAVREHRLNYQLIAAPGVLHSRDPTEEQAWMIRLFDKVEERSRSAALVDGTPEAATFINATLASLQSFKRPNLLYYKH